jgi:hypothetical protein
MSGRALRSMPNGRHTRSCGWTENWSAVWTLYATPWSHCCCLHMMLTLPCIQVKEEMSNNADFFKPYSVKSSEGITA